MYARDAGGELGRPDRPLAGQVVRREVERDCELAVPGAVVAAELGGAALRVEDLDPDVRMRAQQILADLN